MHFGSWVPLMGPEDVTIGTSKGDIMKISFVILGMMVIYFEDSRIGFMVIDHQIQHGNLKMDIPHGAKT